jgi:Ca2+-binding RTX toxin-like protein
MRKREIGAVAGICLACLATPASSSAVVSCSYSGTDHTLSVAAPSSFVGISRSGEMIAVSDGAVEIACSGGTPTLTNTHLVQVSGSLANRISLAGGPLVPGISPDPDGSPEVKFQYLSPGSIDVFGASAADRFGLGPANGINLNGDPDVDVTGPFTRIVLEGRAGNDVIGPQSDYTPTRALVIESGGLGNDTLLSPPDGAVLHGGAGSDRLIGGRGRDNITGGRGSDLIRGRGGRDLIRARDNTRDRVDCGPGRDSVKADGIDKLQGCERRLVKR